VIRTYTEPWKRRPRRWPKLSAVALSPRRWFYAHGGGPMLTAVGLCPKSYKVEGLLVQSLQTLGVLQTSKRNDRSEYLHAFTVTFLSSVTKIFLYANSQIELISNSVHCSVCNFQKILVCRVRVFGKKNDGMFFECRACGVMLQ
jgi:hypothetical protein